MGTDLEERIAHLERTVEDLSDIVAKQAAEIDRLTTQARYLISRERDREADGGVTLADERPPHW